MFQVKPSQVSVHFWLYFI